jgi:hypothetical protein
MNSQEIQNSIYEWAQGKNFTAPYGVLTGEYTNKKGKKYRAVTFGRARTLDATVEIYNRNFIILRTNRNGTEVFNDYVTLMTRLETL